MPTNDILTMVIELIQFGAYDPTIWIHGKSESLLFLHTYFSKEIELADEHWLFSAIRIGNIGILKNLLNHAPADELKSIINKADKNGLTPLDAALISHKKEIILLLLSYGAEPLVGLLNGIKLARCVPDWQLPEGSSLLSLYEQIYAMSFGRYCAILQVCQHHELVNDIIDNLIKIIYSKASYRHYD